MPNQPDWITITRATGFPQWRIVDYEYIDVDHPCNNGGVSAYLKALDANGNYKAGVNVFWATPDDAAKMTMRPQGELGYCYFPGTSAEIPYGVAVQMTADSSFSPDRGEHGPYSAYMEGNSDKISGMGLPLRRHVQFTVVWQLVTAGTEPPPPNPELPKQYSDWRIKKQEPTRIVLVREELKDIP